jgi:hypothetical protein
VWRVQDQGSLRQIQSRTHLEGGEEGLSVRAHGCCKRWGLSQAVWRVRGWVFVERKVRFGGKSVHRRAPSSHIQTAAAAAAVGTSPNTTDDDAAAAHHHRPFQRLPTAVPFTQKRPGHHTSRSGPNRSKQGTAPLACLLCACSLPWPPSSFLDTPSRVSTWRLLSKSCFSEWEELSQTQGHGNLFTGPDTRGVDRQRQGALARGHKGRKRRRDRCWVCAVACP